MKKEKVYENIYRSTHIRYIDVCYSISCMDYKDWRSVMYDQYLKSNYDAWLTNDDSEYVDKDAFEERVKDLLYHNDDYNCCLFENFSEDIYSATTEQAQSIEEYLQNKDFEKLGRLLWCISMESREKFARIQAEKEMDN